jgi:hypothetical protein
VIVKFIYKTYLELRDIVLDELQGILHLLVRKATNTLGDELLFGVGNRAGPFGLRGLALLVPLPGSALPRILLR